MCFPELTLEQMNVLTLQEFSDMAFVCSTIFGETISVSSLRQTRSLDILPTTISSSLKRTQAIDSNPETEISPC